MSLAPHASFHDAPVREWPVLESDAAAPERATRGTLWLDLHLRHAGPRRVRIAWELHGAAAAPVVAVQGGISATRHVAASAAHPEAGWWDAQVGAGRAIDTTRWRVLSIDWLGADGALDCTLDPADQADALAALLDALLDALHIARLHAFVGASYGAMVGLQFAARHGACLGRLVAISGAHRSHPQVTALRVIQRRIVALGRSEGGVREALALARSLAVIGYRSGEEFDARFAAAPQVDAHAARFAVEDYFDAIGPRFVARFTPTAYLRLSESIDLHSVSATQVHVPVQLIAVRQDQVVPLADLEALAAQLPRCRLHLLDSCYGHDAFLKETAAIDALLRGALS